MPIEHEPTSNPPDAPRELLRAAWVVSALSVVWTVAAGTVAIAIGLTTGSAVLVTLGAVGFVDGVGSAALAYHFRHGLEHEALSVELERRAHALVIVGLVTVGASAVVLGLARLTMASTSPSSPAAVGIAVVSGVALLLLARRKQSVSAQLGSDALRSDAHLSTVGAAQAAVALAGTALESAHVDFADPVGATVIGAVTMTIGLRTWRRHR
jgi:divalent metal cation (Fe/Co/Zn/Cd) transporter